MAKGGNEISRVEPERDPSSNQPHTTTTHLVALNFRVPFEFRKQLKSESALQGQSMTNFVIAIVSQHFTKK